MKSVLRAPSLAALGCIGLLAAPATSLAGTVGYHSPAICFLGGNPSQAILAAGHTAVEITTLDEASLAPLDALIVETCTGYANNAVINSAVANGMAVIINDSTPNSNTAGHLPGSPAITFSYAPGLNINLPASSPIITGPGGTLTNASLDGSFLPPMTSNNGYSASSLPAGMIQLLTTNNASRSVALAYPYGNGFVAYNAMPIRRYLPEGAIEALSWCTPTNICAGMRAYLTNLLAWSMEQVNSCAKEGYKNTQLLWCQKICESGLTGKPLEDWIHRWINRFRDLPYCAAGSLD